MVFKAGSIQYARAQKHMEGGHRAVGLLSSSWGVAAQAGGHKNGGQVRFAGIGYIKTERDVLQNVFMDCS